MRLSVAWSPQRCFETTDKVESRARSSDVVFLRAPTVTCCILLVANSV